MQLASDEITAELPDDIRVPLHELWADAEYLLARVTEGSLPASSVARMIKTKTGHIEVAIRAALATQAPAPAGIDDAAVERALRSWMPNLFYPDGNWIIEESAADHRRDMRAALSAAAIVPSTPPQAVRQLKAGEGVSKVHISELLDYALSYGDFDEHTPDGVACKYGGTPMSLSRRTAIVIYKRLLGLLPNDYPLPVAASPEPPAASPVEGSAARDVLAERRRQVEVEGWTPEHDDAHGQGELADAAACYATMAEFGSGGPRRPPSFWPWDKSWWKLGTRRRMLVKAGALILAEIERLDRAATRPSTEAGR